MAANFGGETPMDLRISNLTKDFDGFKAVNNFGFSMDCGVYGLLGVNGAG